MAEKPIEDCRRILILGSGGAGKSTFARKLAERLNIPVVHLDRHFWRSGWCPMEASDWTAEVERLVKAEKWIMDGNYDGSLKIRLARADAVFYLDFSTTLCLFRACRRWWRYLGKNRPDMAPGCPERLSLEFLVWIAGFRKHTRPNVLKILAEKRESVPLITFTGPRQVERYLEGLSPENS